MNETFVQSIQGLLINGELVVQLLDMFPVPVVLYEPDGTMVFINQAFLKLNKIPDLNLVVGKYNVLHDPIVNGRRDFQECFRRAFRGEAVCAADFPAALSFEMPVDRETAAGKTFQTAFGDMFLSPLWNGEKIAYILCVFVVKRIYQGRSDAVYAREYIDSHWQDEYDPRTVAKSVNMSVTPFYQLFKQHIGMPPGVYHKKVRVEHIKEKLAEKNMTIKEAFAACGEDSRGRIARVFKEVTGMSPTKYVESLK